MTTNNKGVFNGPQHAEEIDMLMRGDYKQFTKIVVDATNVGAGAPNAGNRGLYEIEGNALCVMPSIMDNDGNELKTGTYSQQLGQSLPNIYVRFNHVDNPYLPIGLSNGNNTNPTIPVGYCLTFGRFWIWVQRNPALPIILLVTRGVSLYSPGMGPVVIGGYQAPTWQKLK